MNKHWFSASSLLALAVASIGPAQAFLANPPAGAPDLLALSNEESQTSDAAAREQRALAAIAEDVSPRGFTGPIDPGAASGQTYPATPLGAAAGTRDEVPLAWAIPGMDRLDGLTKARLISEERVGPLIGSIGGTSSATANPGGSVFVASGFGAGFNDSGAPVNGGTGAAGASSTATITATGAAILAQAGKVTPYVAVAGKTDPNQTSASDADRTEARTAPDLTYTYAPLGGGTPPRRRDTAYTPPNRKQPNAAQTVEVTASFSNAITAKGLPPIEQQRALNEPIKPAIERGQDDQADLENLNDYLVAEASSHQFRSVNTTALYRRMVEMGQAIWSPLTDLLVDGRHAVISVSVAADPAGAAERYLASIANLVPRYQQNPAAETFAVGVPEAPGKGGGELRVSIYRPLKNRILASSGPLNNDLILH